MPACARATGIPCRPTEIPHCHVQLVRSIAVARYSMAAWYLPWVNHAGFPDELMSVLECGHKCRAHTQTNVSVEVARAVRVPVGSIALNRAIEGSGVKLKSTSKCPIAILV